MQAGFARVEITPPLGTRLMGWGAPSQRPMSAVHDPLYARALVVSDGQQDVAIIALDLCFIGREDTHRLHGLIARELGLLPRQVLIAATHTHAGPDVGSYYEAMILPPQRDYLAQLEQAVLSALRQALQQRQPVRLRATRGRSSLPMNRRPLDAQGKNSAGNAPNPGGPVQDVMPLCLFEHASTGKPVCLLFSIATHPVCFSGTQASADYPGVACDLLDRHLGAACSLFLQGCAGDSRPRTLQDGAGWLRLPGEKQTIETGTILADEVKQALATLQPMRDGRVDGRLIEVQVPLQAPNVAEYQQALRESNPVRVAWAKRQLTLLEQGRIARHAPLLLHAVQLGPHVRLGAIEGEPLHPYAAIIDRVLAADGVTFPLGYVHGEGVYLITTPMLAESGYEPGSYWEYNYPSPLAPGMEKVIEAGLAELRTRLEAN